MTTADTENKAPDTPENLATLPQATSAASMMAHAAPHKPKRTLGLRLVDALIYPITNNIGVFGISVVATYLTEHGWPQPANGKQLAGWKQSIGNFFQQRGKKLDAFFEKKFNWSHDIASMARMVAFSFIDGTFVAPFVKVLEDRREKMALAIDTALGTKPDDESVYEAEPKQSWRSVVEGRLLTSLVVVPTAVALSKIKNADNHSLNDILFNNPGAKHGAIIETKMPKLKAGIEKVFGKVNMPFFIKTSYFEAFYTSVCTAGLYLISRSVAKKHPAHEKHHGAHAPIALPAADDAAEQPTTEQAATPETPQAKITQTEHVARIAANDPRMEIRA